MIGTSRIRGVLASASLLATACLAGCGAFHQKDFPTDGPSVTATSNPAKVKSSDFGHSWNLKVDHGTVTCKDNSDGDPILYFTAPNGIEYALNHVKGNGSRRDIDDISNGSVGPLRFFAFTVCDVK